MKGEVQANNCHDLSSLINTGIETMCIWNNAFWLEMSQWNAKLSNKEDDYYNLWVSIYYQTTFRVNGIQRGFFEATFIIAIEVPF